MSTIELRAEPRSVVGKKVRFLRRQGLVPANIFGQSASTAVQVPVKEVEQTIRRAGRNQLVSLAIAGGETTTVLITHWQRHPYKTDLLHVDFFRVAMTEKMQLAVPLVLVGEAPAVKLTGGNPFQTLAAVTVECLPSDIPASIEVDISGLAANDDSIFVRELIVPAGVTIVSDVDEQIVKIMAPRVAQADIVEDDEAVSAAEDGEEAPESSESE